MLAKNRNMQQAQRPGEEKMAGVNCAIDAVEYRAVSSDSPEKQDPMQTIRQITELVNPTGAIGPIGVLSPDYYNYTNSPYALLSNIQVTVGSGAAGLYGVDVIGGTIDFQTLNPTKQDHF